MRALFTFYSFRIRAVRVPDTQKQTWWWGVKLGQVGSWVMVLMPLSLPPTPLWHHWFKQGLPWNTETTAGSCLGASCRGACGGGGGQTALQCNRTGCSHGSERFPPPRSHHHPSNSLARPGHARGPLQPEPTAAAPGPFKTGRVKRRQKRPFK